MYSLKKTILNILICIAAAGVATADDTTSASSVSLSLSLTNVVPSNKAGKQTKAGKQVKAAVLGKAVKAKALKDYNSLSSSMSMSYGPDVDPDSEKAGLQFSVDRSLSHVYDRGIATRSFNKDAGIFITGLIQFFASRTLNIAVDAVCASGRTTIQSKDIEAAIISDSDLSWVFPKYDDWVGIQPVDSYTLAVSRFLYQTIDPDIKLSVPATKAVSQLATYALNRVGTEAENIADDQNEPELSIETVSKGLLKVLFRLQGGDPPTTFSDDAFTFALRAVDEYKQ